MFTGNANGRFDFLVRLEFDAIQNLEYIDVRFAEMQFVFIMALELIRNPKRNLFKLIRKFLSIRFYE